MVQPSPEAELIRDFVNTVDVEEATDAFATPEGLRDWLARTGLDTGAPYADALALRRGLRARLLINNAEEAPAEDIAAGEAVLARLPLTVVLGASATPEEPPFRAGGELAALGPIAAAWAHVVSSGAWRRLKQCPNHECAWVFWDASRSRTQRWCTMRVCGNRAKTRAYAARKREE